MDDLERRLRAALQTAAEPPPPGLLAAVRRRRTRHLRRVGAGCIAAVTVLAVAIPPAARALRAGTGPAPAVGAAHHAAHGAHGPARPAPATQPVAGTALVDCRSERNGPLSPTWQAQSVRVGPVWFVYAGIEGPWTASLPLGGGYVPSVSAGQPTRAISVIIAVRNGSTVEVSAAPAARQHLRFLTVPGQDLITFSRRYGHPGLTLMGCPASPASPVGTGIPESYAAGLTVYWVPYLTDLPRCVPLVIRELPGGRPVRFTLSRSGGACPAR